MDKKRGSLLIFLLIVTSLLLSSFGFFGKETVYATYDYGAKDDVLLALPLKGIRDGIYPFAVLDARPEVPDEPEDVPDVADADMSDPSDEQETPLPPDADPAVGEATPEPEPEPEENTPDVPDVPQETPPVEEVPVQTDPVQQETIERPEITGAPMDDSYYADALFIGDSRTVGLSQYVPGLDQYASFYCAVSLSVFNALSAQIANVDGVSMSVDEALSKQMFGKIYIMVGINEIGYERNAWLETYRGVIARIRELQPDAVIYIQSIMHVSSGKEAAQPVFNNAEVNARNAGLQAFANGSDIFYIDINYLIDDANGALSADLTFDGVHLTANAYDLWYQEIKAQTH